MNGKNQKSVFVYIAILFSAALFLIGYSFLMTHRSNQEMLGELKDSIAAMESMEDAEKRLLELHNELRALQAAHDELEADMDRKQAELLQSESTRVMWEETAAANAALAALEYHFARGDTARCMEILEKMETSAARLSTESVTENVPSPAERYETIKKELSK
ncbi:MAG: hypothetical protein IJA73_04795 [Oscillospiraceae bacterium]|nr:hypothetical protein [Oscillospiraceae bacterium]